MNKWIYVCVAFLIFSVSGCTRVWLDHRHYTPDFSTQEFPDYKGKDVFISIYHQSDNSDFAYYYSDSHIRLRYTSHPSINNYLYYSYLKAFFRAGFIIHEHRPEVRIIPELRILILSLSDEKMVIEPQILLDAGLRYSKTFIITMPPVAERSQKALEQNAYAMINKSAIMIMNDKDFHGAFLKAIADKNINWQPMK